MARPIGTKFGGGGGVRVSQIPKSAPIGTKFGTRRRTSGMDIG